MIAPTTEVNMLQYVAQLFVRLAAAYGSPVVQMYEMMTIKLSIVVTSAVAVLMIVGTRFGFVGQAVLEPDLL